MAKFKGNPKRTVNKIRPGERKVQRVKSSNFLPAVFQTDINKKWLDSTFDQMISKADLQDLDAYVGSKLGKHRSVNDSYIEETSNVKGRIKTQLEPAVTTKDKLGNIKSFIGVDDIANRVNLNFDDFNYNAGYSTESYVYTPPINVDMFANFGAYYWINNMPEYTSVNTGIKDFPGDGQTTYYAFADGRTITGVEVDDVAKTDGVDFDFNTDNTAVTFRVAPALMAKVEIIGAATTYTTGPITDNALKPIGSITDDNGTWELQEGMLVRFGSGYTDTYTGFSNDKCYLITGVGDSLKFIEYKDENNNLLWADYTQYKEIIGDYWDENRLISLNKIGPAKRIKSIIVGRTYQISRLGDTDWNAIANTTGVTYAVGDQVTAVVNPTAAGEQDSTGLVQAVDQRNKTPIDIVADYNANTGRGPGLTFNFGNLNKTSYLEAGMLLTFGEDWDYTVNPDIAQTGRQYKIQTVGNTDWNAMAGTTGITYAVGDRIAVQNVSPAGTTGVLVDELQVDRIYEVEIDSATKDITLRRLISARYDSNGDIEQIIPGDLTEAQLETVESIQGKWDADGWDSDFYASPTKDYIVVERACDRATAWSRVNHWIHRDTIDTMLTLMPEQNITDFITRAKQAKRPIICFDKNIQMMNHGTTQTWHGFVDFVFANEIAEVTEVQDGLKYVLTDSNKIYQKQSATDIISGQTYKILVPGTADYTTIGSADNVAQTTFTATGTLTGVTGTVAREVATMAAGDTILPLQSPAITETNPYDPNVPRETYKYRDAYWNGTALTVAQIKARANQPIFFKLQDSAKTALDDDTKYPESSFRGNQILQYKTTELQESIDYDLSVYGYVTAINRAKLKEDFRLYDDNSNVDGELVFPLEYKDMGKGADYVFENTLNTRIYDYTVQTHRGNTIGKKRVIPGYYAFVNHARTKTNYRPSYITSGAKKTVSSVVTDGTQNLKLSVGYDNWRPAPTIGVGAIRAGEKYQIESVGTTDFTLIGSGNNNVGTIFTATGAGSGTGRVSGYRNTFKVYTQGNQSLFISDLSTQGNENFRQEDEPDIILTKGALYKFYDMIGAAKDQTNVLTFYEEDGTTAYTTNVARVDEDGDGFQEAVTIHAPSDKNILLRIGYPNITGVDKRQGRIFTVDNTDYIYHEVFVNGKPLATSKYTITNNEIEIPASELATDDIVDLLYYPNTKDTSTNTLVPEVHSHNPLNQTLSTFTISETLDHWTSLLYNTADFAGESFGFNNTHKRIRNYTVGGKIFIHNNLSVMHDLNYADETMDISTALFEQGKDWWSFKQRFENQVIRLYASNAYTNTREIVDDAIEQIVATKRGTDLHKYSNMLFAPAATQNQKITYTEYDASDLTVGVAYKITELGLTDWNAVAGTTGVTYAIGTQLTVAAVDSTTAAGDIGKAIKQQEIIPAFTANADMYHRDHLYVYLTELFNGEFIQRSLVKDIEYTMTGTTLNIVGIPSPSTGGDVPFVTVYWHDMDSESYIPASMAKLGLTQRSIPAIHTNVMVAHDGTTYDIDNTRDLYNPNASNFDLINACYWELEKRCYTGMVDTIDSATAEEYMPGQHRALWYTTADIDNYIERYYIDWANKTGNNTGYEPENFYDAANDRTWNYSTVTDFTHDGTYTAGKFLIGTEYTIADPGTTDFTLIGAADSNTGTVFTATGIGTGTGTATAPVTLTLGHLDRLPGHWRGAYRALFGTDSPHLTPWNMLGIDRKPSWWDTYYPSAEVSGSWADATKREKLNESLRRGVISEPNSSNEKQDLKFARHYWDFDNRHPVADNGTLVARSTILGTGVANIDKAAPFVFGDYGPVEIDWRNSSLGQAAIIDAVIQLNPVRAFTTFFQPGYFNPSDDYHRPWLISNHTEKLIAPVDLYYHDETYGKILKRIDVRDSSTGWGPNSTLQILNGDSTIIGTGLLDINEENKIQSVTLTGRGIEYVDDPVLDFINSFGGAANAYVDATPVLTTNPFISSGLCQAQFNYIKRKYKNTDLEQQYFSLDTQLLQKVGGFTNKNLITFQTESGNNGTFRISESDYDNFMYKGSPAKLCTASIVKITKNLTDFTLTGISPGKQQFKFYEPDITVSTAFQSIPVDDSVIKKWRNYNRSTVSTLEFDSKLSKIQDVYNFVRGYFYYLEIQGFDWGDFYSGDAKAYEFAEWAINASANEDWVIYLPETVNFKPRRGHVEELGTMPGNLNNVLDENGLAVTDTGLQVSRTDDTVTYEIMDGKEWGSIAVSVIDYEHAIIFSNITKFNETINDSLLNQRQMRLKVNGQRTRDWTGRRNAPGYLVQDNKIIENFDTSVRKIDDYYSYNIENLNPGVTKAENLSIGNIDRDWEQNFNMDANTIGKFYQGWIRDKGTNATIDGINRSTLVNFGTSKVTADEEWMFRHSYFGDTRQTKSTEILVTPTTSTDFSPKLIDYTSSNITFVNDQRSGGDVFDTQDFDTFAETNKFYSAGALLENESDYAILKASDIKSVYDSTKDYATIETWNGQTSYKRGDQVRYQGKLYQCNVDFIGFTEEATDLTFTGSVINPVFEHARQSDGDPASLVITSPYDASNPTNNQVSVYLDRQDTVYDNVVAVGNAGATVNSPSSITIDGYTIALSYTPSTTIVDTSAVNNGNPYVKTGSITSIADNTGKQLSINGTVIDLFDTSLPAGSSITQADIINFINASDGSGLLTAAVHTGQDGTTADSTKIFISYNVQGDVSLNLVIGTASANSDLGLTANSYPSAQTTSNQDGTMTPSIMANLIEQSNILPANYFADVSLNDELRITRTPPVGTPAATLVLSGPATTGMGLPLTTTQTSSQVDAFSNVQQAATQIQTQLTAGGIANVTVTVVDNQLRIATTNASINLGDANNEVNAKAGFSVSGPQFSTDTVVDNTFDVSQWLNKSREDKALFNIWLTDDGSIDDVNQTTNGIQSKFYDWNVLQVQRGYVSGTTYSTDTDVHGWYTLDDQDPDGCGICAGTATQDGNDARVTINVDHNLEVGDYVMILNSTTQPSVDGIHKVTKLGSAGEIKAFYIDMYIDKCGNAPVVFPLRNARFENNTDRDSTLTAEHYIWNDSDLVWVTKDASGVNSTNVYRYVQATNSWNSVRNTATRVTNSTIENVIMYDGDNQETIIELEIFDPIRGIIPGVADREIDQKSSVDIAVYTDSTDVTFVGDERNAWGEHQVGKTWWDLSKVLYYDYDQGGVNYRTTVWGQLFPGSEICVYEWTKSSVTPDEWATSVDSQLDMYGQIASGEAYGVYDPEREETTYHYTEQTEWNTSTQVFDTVYYFWVKNKTTVPNINRKLSTKQISDIITNPSANGISWCAAIGANQFIVQNISYYLSDSSILQVNKKTTSADHNSWTLIRENKDEIPQYWFLGLRDNIIGQQRGTNVIWPNEYLNKYNRYGDNRELGQGWFTNTYDARREAVELANDMLIHMNIIEDLEQQWDRNIGYGRHVIDIGNDVTNTIADWKATTQYAPGDKVKYNRYVYNCLQYHTANDRNDFLQSAGNWQIEASLYDLTKMWDYADYVSEDRFKFQAPSIVVSSKTAIDALDTNKHTLAMLKIWDDTVKLDRSEIFAWNANKADWILVEKKNATIQFNDIIWNPDQIALWDEDEDAWDSRAWDSDTIVFVEYFVTALRNDLFIEQFKENFNKFFFGMVKYVHSIQRQVDWCYKTTYIQVDVETPISNVHKKYVKNNVDSVEGYINTVKPFHTKMRNVFEKYTIVDESTMSVTEEEDKRTVIQNIGPYNPSLGVPTAATPLVNNEFPVVYGGDSYKSTYTSTGVEATAETIQGAGFTDTTDYDNVEGGEFLQPNNYNYIDETTWGQATWATRNYSASAYRRSLAGITPLENLNIVCLTNPSGSSITTDSRTFTYMQDNWLNVQAYSLADTKDTTTTSIAWATATSYNIGDIVVFQDKLYKSKTAHTSGNFKTDTSTHWEPTDEFPVTDESVFNASGGYAWYNGEIIKYGGTTTGKLLFVKRARKGTFEKAYTAGQKIVDVTSEELSTFSRMDYRDNVVGYRFSVDGPSLSSNTATGSEAVDLRASGQGMEL